MNFVYAAFLLLVVFFFLRSSGAFPDEPIEADPQMVEFGIGLLIIVGILAFRLGIWAKGAKTGFQPQEAKAKTAKTPFQMMRETYVSIGLMILGLTTFSALVLELTGHHEELMQVLEFLHAKGEKFINALLH